MHLKKSTGTTEKNSQEIRFGLFGPKTRNSQIPARILFGFGGFLSAWNYPETHSELVEQGDPNASPSNHTIENTVFGSAIETAIQERLNLAQPLNSHKTK